MNGEGFWDRLDKSGGPESCWPWIGAYDSNGYGAVKVYGRKVNTHRRAWELSRGPIPPGTGHHGTVVMHECDNKSCCNPAHLRLGSQLDNIADMDTKGHRVRGETNGTSRLKESDVRAARQLHSEGGLSMYRIARMMGVADSTIRDIVRRETWAHVA